MAMYLNLSSPAGATDDQVPTDAGEDSLQPPLSASSNKSSNNSNNSNNAIDNATSITGNKRKCMELSKQDNLKGSGGGMKTIDPLTLLQDDLAKSFSMKRQRIDNNNNSNNSTDFSVPLTGNDESFTSSYVFLHSTVSRPASSTSSSSSTTQAGFATTTTSGGGAGGAGGYSLNPPSSSSIGEEERILREEFYSQTMSPFSLASGGGQSGSFGSLAGYGLPPSLYSSSASTSSPQGMPPSSYAMLPSFNLPPPPQPLPSSSYYNNNNNNYNAYFNSQEYYGYPRNAFSSAGERERERDRELPPSSPSMMRSMGMGMPPYPPYPSQPSIGIGCGMREVNPINGCGMGGEEFVAETKLSKNIKKMTTVLSQVPGLEKIRWQVSEFFFFCLV